MSEIPIMSTLEGGWVIRDPGILVKLGWTGGRMVVGSLRLVLNWRPTRQLLLLGVGALVAALAVRDVNGSQSGTLRWLLLQVVALIKRLIRRALQLYAVAAAVVVNTRDRFYPEYVQDFNPLYRSVPLLTISPRLPLLVGRAPAVAHQLRNVAGAAHRQRRVTLDVDDEKAAVRVRSMLGVGFVMAQARFLRPAGDCPHTIHRFARAAAEQVAYNHVSAHTCLIQDAWILDVGAAMVRHIHNRRTDIWSLVPIIDVADAGRVELRAGNLGCRCTLNGFCTGGCHLCQNLSDIGALLFVHSLYYITPQELIQSMVSLELTMAVSVHHRFRGTGGAWVGESSWFRVSDTQVKMDAGENIYGPHSDMEWLDTKQQAVVDGIEWSLIARVLRQVSPEEGFPLEVVEFRVAETATSKAVALVSQCTHLQPRPRLPPEMRLSRTGERLHVAPLGVDVAMSEVRELVARSRGQSRDAALRRRLATWLPAYTKQRGVAYCEALVHAAFSVGLEEHVIMRRAQANNRDLIEAYERSRVCDYPTREASVWLLRTGFVLSWAAIHGAFGVGFPGFVYELWDFRTALRFSIEPFAALQVAILGEWVGNRLLYTAETDHSRFDRG